MVENFSEVPNTNNFNVLWDNVLSDELEDLRAKHLSKINETILKPKNIKVLKTRLMSQCLLPCGLLIKLDGSDAYKFLESYLDQARLKALLMFDDPKAEPGKINVSLKTMIYRILNVLFSALTNENAEQYAPQVKAAMG